MPELSPETIGLLIGLSFSVAVFAFKTAVGEFYALSGANGRKKLWLLTGSTAVYILLFAAAFLFDSFVHPFAFLQNGTLLQAGIGIHLLIAAGFFLWGVLLLTSENGHRPARGWWLLIIPCPVCASVIIFATSFAGLLLPDAVRTVRLFVPGLFFAVNFSILGLLELSIRKGGMDPRNLTGRLMLFIGIYFAGLLFLVPNFDRIEQMYRIVAGQNGETGVNWQLPVLAGGILTAGWLFQIYNNKRRSRDSVREGVK